MTDTSPTAEYLSELAGRIDLLRPSGQQVYEMILFTLGSMAKKRGNKVAFDMLNTVSYNPVEFNYSNYDQWKGDILELDLYDVAAATKIVFWQFDEIGDEFIDQCVTYYKGQRKKIAVVKRKAGKK